MKIRKYVRRLIFPTFAVLVFLAILFVGYTNRTQIEELRDQGKPYNDSAITFVAGKTGATGAQGAKGDTPSQAEVRQAVADYCASSGLCTGQPPSPAVVYAAVNEYCAQNRCRGADGSAGTNGSSGVPGSNGRDGADASDVQIQTQVANYCGQNSCTGPAGSAGSNGINGRTPVIRCIERSNNQFIAWKYEDEPDTAYRDLVDLPLLSDCVDPITVS